MRVGLWESAIFAATPRDGYPPCLSGIGAPEGESAPQSGLTGEKLAKCLMNQHKGLALNS